MSFVINFDNLWVSKYPEKNKHAIWHLSKIRDDIHGLLTITIGDRDLPCLGYFGPEDVCFETWVCELRKALDALEKSNKTQYKFDEGEQGQPAFLFEREGDEVFVSIVDSEWAEESGGWGIPEWQRVHCEFNVFSSAVTSFIKEFRDCLFTHTPNAKWWWDMAIMGDDSNTEDGPLCDDESQEFFDYKKTPIYINAKLQAKALAGGLLALIADEPEKKYKISCGFEDYQTHCKRYDISLDDQVVRQISRYLPEDMAEELARDKAKELPQRPWWKFWKTNPIRPYR